MIFVNSIPSPDDVSVLYFFDLSFLIVPIFLSLLVSLPFRFRIVPAGSPSFFSSVPTLQSLLIFLILHLLLSFVPWWFVLFPCIQIIREPITLNHNQSAELASPISQKGEKVSLCWHPQLQVHSIGQLSRNQLHDIELSGVLPLSLYSQMKRDLILKYIWSAQHLISSQINIHVS